MGAQTELLSTTVPDDALYLPMPNLSAIIVKLLFPGASLFLVYSVATAVLAKY